jgi:hypothetical protein
MFPMFEAKTLRGLMSLVTSIQGQVFDKNIIKGVPLNLSWESDSLKIDSLDQIFGLA